MSYDFDWGILWSDLGIRLLEGALVTLQLAGCSLFLALVIGIFFGVLRWVGGRIIEPICWLYIEFHRNTPPLVQILFWYFSASYILPTPVIQVLRDLNFQFVACVIALSLYHGAFIAEVVRAGLKSVPQGQYDAAKSLGLGFVRRLRLVIFPQVFRIILPSLANEVVSLIKNTALALAVGVAELTYQAKYIDAYYFRGVEALTAATAIYLVLCLSMSGLGLLWNRRLSRHLQEGQGR